MNEEKKEKRRRLKRRLLYILRYGATKLGLNVSARGFVSLDDLMKLHLMRHDTKEEVLNIMKHAISSVTGKKQFEMKEIYGNGETILIRVTSGRIMEPSINHEGSNIPRLLNICLEAICKKIKLYDFEDFPDEFLMRRIFMRLKYENKLTNTIMKSLISSTMERYDFTDIYITESTLKLLSQRCKKLKQLCLGGSSYLLTDTLVKLLAKNLRYLNNLNMRGCEGVTDKSFEHFLTFKTPLEILNISHCPQITFDGVYNFISKCTTLNVICVTGLKMESSIDKLHKSSCNKDLLIISSSTKDSSDEEESDKEDPMSP